jgi:hypothetical protein
VNANRAVYRSLSALRPSPSPHYGKADQTPAEQRDGLVADLRTGNGEVLINEIAVPEPASRNPWMRFARPGWFSCSQVLLLACSFVQTSGDPSFPQHGDVEPLRASQFGAGRFIIGSPVSCFHATSSSTARPSGMLHRTWTVLLIIP